MFFRFPHKRGVVYLSLLGMLAFGCRTVPVAQFSEFEEGEDIEGLVVRTEMMKHRGRAEPKTGIMIPINTSFDIATPADGVSGIKASYEAIQKGMFFGIEFNYVNFESKSPITRGSSQAVQLAADTEDLMKEFDRYQMMLTWDYDIPLGESLYSPIFRFGIGLGAVAIHPHEADGNTLIDIDDFFMFVGRPSVGFRFPFHENIAGFIEANYDFIPEGQLTGEFGNQTVDVGDKVDFSSGNVWIGLSFEW